MENINKRNELLDFLVELRADKEALDTKLKALNAEIDGIEEEIIEDMIARNDGSFNHNGVTCSLRLTERYSPEPEYKDKLWVAMRRRKYGPLFTIPTNTLSAEIKRLKADNNDKLPKWLVALVKVYEQPGLTIRKGTDISKTLQRDVASKKN